MVYCIFICSTLQQRWRRWRLNQLCSRRKVDCEFRTCQTPFEAAAERRRKGEDEEKRERVRENCQRQNLSRSWSRTLSDQMQYLNLFNYYARWLHKNEINRYEMSVVERESLRPIERKNNKHLLFPAINSLKYAFKFCKLVYANSKQNQHFCSRFSALFLLAQ